MSSAAREVRALMVEDSPADAELVRLELERGGLRADLTRVSTAEALGQALDGGGWDVIIADYHVPGMGGLEALRMVQSRGLDLPFIVVSGVIGEETAVEAMRTGAHDYVLKQNLTRLSAAVARELREAEMRRERQQAREAARVLARRSALLAEVSRKLARSLDHEETLLEAARCPLPEIADWCLLVAVDERTLRLRVVAAHRDADREGRARHLLGRFPPDPHAPSGAAEVIRSGRPTGSAPDTLLPCRGEPEATLLAGVLGHGSAVWVPLPARGGVMGALALGRSHAADLDLATLPADELAFLEEVAARAALALEHAVLYRQAREAIRVRDEFLSAASHELNTPLTTLTLQLDQLGKLTTKAAPAGPIARMVAEALSRSGRQVHRLNRLVEDLLDASRMSSGPPPLLRKPADLGNIAREVVEQLSVELAQAGCQVRVEASGPVVGNWDALRIARVLDHLLSNARKYGAGRDIELCITRTERLARLCVRDYGIGIASADRDRIFDLFERAAPLEQYGGLGLGLTLTRHLVEAHGGRIRLASEPGLGAVFLVELPLA